MTEPDLNAFVEDLRDRVEHRLEDSDVMARDAFVEVVREHLVDSGVLDDLTACYLNVAWQQRRVEIAGYDISDDGTILHLVGVDYGLTGSAVKRDRVDQILRRLRAFAEFCRTGQHAQLEPSNPAYDMVQRINASWSDLVSIRLLVLTDGVTSIRKLKEGPVADLPASISVWDLPRLQKLLGPATKQEDIEIDLRELGYSVPCLESKPQLDGYRCLMVVLPGVLLAELYEEHHSRLLQRNVRAFLQARGKVNKAIAETIRDEPGRFLAYNNGISATAKAATLESSPEGPVLVSLTELQIVNGGQTTASLHHARRRGLSLDEVNVPAKITIVDDETLDPMIPLISKYANSQNSVTSADFEANSPFHVGLEHQSRGTWSTGPDGEQTRWYYERVRGQYEVEKNREPTLAKRKSFEARNPRDQRINKTDAAKYEYAYGLRPHLVNLGGQKCFLRWTAEEKVEAKEPPTQEYFRHLVGKAILFNGIRSTIAQGNVGGYLGQITALTLSLLVDRLGAVDLDQVWRSQAVPEALRQVVPEVSAAVRDVVTHPPNSANVTEWCKKEACWAEVRGIAWTPTDELVRAVAVPAT